VLLNQIPRYSNVRVFTKTNDCLDFGGWRHALDRVAWRNGTYSHFVFMNSSVRGPFLPSYLPRTFHWTTLFTQFITDPSLAPGPVKLVGLTISCFQTPHVQSMLWVTDLVRLPLAMCFYFFSLFVSSHFPFLEAYVALLRRKG
jgi:hypothetical protein